MKTIATSFFSACLLPITLLAQPTVNNNEYYNAGDNIRMVNCDTTSLNAGSAGAAVTWDFSLLSASGGYSLTSIITDTTSSPSIIANIDVILPNGTEEYIEENSTDSYINGIYDPVSGVTAYCSGYDIAKRPVTYNTNYIDTYSISMPGASGFHGEGYIVETGDAYGKLMLPGSTYDNVLRIKKVQYEVDTPVADPTTTIVSNITSYLWFDGVHAAPLLRIDSLISTTSESRSIMYLATTTGVQNASNNASAYNVWFDNNTLALTGNFEANESYEVTVYDMIGAKIFNQQFTGNSDNQRFDVNRQVAPGIYIVSIAQTNDLSTPEMIKIVKH